MYEDNQRDLELITVSPQATMKSALAKLQKKPGVDIHGKKYHTVAERLEVFNEFFTGYGIETEIIFQTEEKVTFKTVIRTPAKRIVATGHASENATTRGVNSTSHEENCETSSIGRALAVFGLGGQEVASANELENALREQTSEKATERVIKNNE